MIDGKESGHGAHGRGPDDPERAEVARSLLDAFLAIMSPRWKAGYDPGKHAGFRVLRLLADEDPERRGFRVNELCERLGVKPPTVTRLVDALEKQGLAERARDPDDRRASRVRASGTGLELAASARLRAEAELSGLVERLGEGDARTLARLLERSAAYFTERHARGSGKENHHTC